MSVSYKIKEAIVGRLHNSSGLCSFCGKPGCGHLSNTTLPGTLSLADVLEAIDLDGDSDEVNLCSNCNMIKQCPDCGEK